jgi:two-component system cell cycle response regulator
VVEESIAASGREAASDTGSPGARLTLRGRLTAAFLTVVLGPVLLGAIFVVATTTATDRRQAVARLHLAAAVVRSSVHALCQQLRATAGALAVIGDPAARAGAATTLVAREVAAAVLVTDPGGMAVLITQDAPARPWTDCAGPPPAPETPVRALAARAELRDATGTVTGAIWVAHRLDLGFVARLAAATGTEVTLLTGAAAVPAASTAPASSRPAVLAAAARTSGEGVTRVDGHRYVRRVGPSAGQPLPLVLSTSREPVPSWYPLLAGTVLLAGAVAVVGARRLARATTRPLVELARAADRVAGGDPMARVPVRSPDELARLACTFNRLHRDRQSYLEALNASREQLRDHLAVLGQTLAGTHDLARILPAILRGARAATGARAGLVMLFDPATGKLVTRAAEGFHDEPDDTSPEARVPLASGLPIGSGILGTVAATGVPMRGRPGRDAPTPAPIEPTCRSYLAVPLAPADDASGGGPTGDHSAAVTPPLGVLALYDRHGGDEFDDGDLATLRTLAGDAAVAVENVRLHEEVQRLSLTDPLTGLWNYRYLEESLRREVERASRFGRMLALLALDLDRFKKINDTYGHAAGDVVLTEFARRIRGALREVDLAFRRGGEEFVVLLPETDVRGAATVAQRLGVATRSMPITVDPLPGTAGRKPLHIAITVSIGIAVYPYHATTGPQALAAADDALYAAKAGGRDTYRIASCDRRWQVEYPLAARATPPVDSAPRAGTANPTSETGRGGGSDGALSEPQPPRPAPGR